MESGYFAVVLFSRVSSRGLTLEQTIQMTPDDTNPVASDALVSMVVALNGSWKLPVAYFLIHGMSGVERANLIEQCLCKLADIGIWITSLTCDGPSCHLTMLNTLGASMTMPDLRPSFPHPQKPEHHVSVFLDICHMLKLMRNALASYKVFKDGHGNSIKWEFIKELLLSYLQPPEIFCNC